MDPAIGAALIGLGAAVIGVTCIVAGVYITACRTQDQKRQELVVSALSDYIMAAAKLVSALKLKKFAQSLSDETRRQTVEKEALDAYRQSDEIAAQAKVRLLAFADSDVVENLASWDRDSSLADPHRQRALLAVVDSVRRQPVGSTSASTPELDRLGLMFGWPDERDRSEGEVDGSP